MERLIPWRVNENKVQVSEFQITIRLPNRIRDPSLVSSAALADRLPMMMYVVVILCQGMLDNGRCSRRWH